MSRSRAAAVVVAAVLLALLLWLAWRSDSGVTGRATTPDRSADERTNAAVVVATPRRARPKSGAGDDAPSAAGDAEPDGSPLFPPLEVVVRLADGTWRADAGAFAYALPPGDTGADGPVARADLEADGTCTLRLPRPGVYDVGAVGGGEFLWTLATDVDSRTTPRVTLTMPPTADVRFVPDGGRERVAGGAYVEADDDRPVAATPGRGAVPPIDCKLGFEDLPTTWRVAAGVRLRYRHGNNPSTATPDRFAAPATVVIGLPPWGSYEFVYSVDPTTDRPAERESWFGYKLDVESGGVVDHWAGVDGLWELRAGQRPSDQFRFTFRQKPHAPHVAVRWKGNGVRAGAVEFDVPEDRDAIVKVPIVLQIEDGPLPTSEFVVRVDGPRDAGAVAC